MKTSLTVNHVAFDLCSQVDGIEISSNIRRLNNKARVVIEIPGHAVEQMNYFYIFVEELVDDPMNPGSTIWQFVKGTAISTSSSHTAMELRDKYYREFRK